MEKYINKAGLGKILDKVQTGTRLSFEDGRLLYQCNDILALGHLANIVRNRMNGDKAYFIYNQHINYSNICNNLCKFCAFGREKDSELAYEMSVDEVKAKVKERLSEPITEIHMVGGIHPDLPFDYYIDLLRGIKEVKPNVHIQAFTCVEIAHLASIAQKSIEDTLGLLTEAGLGSLPGGGAEVFSPRIRALTCDKKISGKEWLHVSKVAHKQGLN
ncbi:MAG: radical SAM protein, partial [Desulforhopalus sp.]